MPTPAAEIEIDEALVRQLLESQHPDLADGELNHVADGWDNSTWRLDVAVPQATRLTVRLPRRAAAADLIRSEQCWLNRLSDGLPIEVPEVVRVGEATEWYPWPWSVCRWIDGGVLGTAVLEPGDVERFAGVLARLHQPAHPKAPSNPFRGVPLAARREPFLDHLGRSQDRGLITPQEGEHARKRFERAAETAWRGVPVWLHGDLHPRNVLMRDGRWIGLLDWGDLTAGDPASDLASAWMLVDDSQRQRFWARYRNTCHHHLARKHFEELERRAAAWALYFGILMLEAGTPDDPTFASVGRRLLDQLVARRP